MRKVFLFVLLLFLVAFGFFLSGSRKSVDKANLKQNNVQKQKEMTDLDPTPITNTFIFDGQQYEYAYKMVPSSSNIFLFPNFTTKYTSNEIIKNLNCIFGINGGFYQKDGTPLGLFYIDNKMLSVQIQSATFDGFIAKKNNSKNLIIGEIASDLGVVDSYEFIVQSGPY